MTQPYEMPENPGDPDNTDPEATSADRAERAAGESEFRQPENPETDPVDPEIDPTLEAEIDEALADFEVDVETDINPDADGDGVVSDTERQLAERTEDLQRVTAEYANYRRRTERERQGVIDSAKASVVTQLLPVLDDLDLAAQHGDLEQGPLKAVADKLTTTLESMKVTPFGTPGEEFDPEIHEAVQDLSTGDQKIIGTVLRKGYRLGDRLIRNAMVIIADPQGE